MIWEGHYISEVMGGCSDRRSNGGLDCKSDGSSQVSEPIHMIEQVGEVLRGDGEVTLMGPKYG